MMKKYKQHLKDLQEEIYKAKVDYLIKTEKLKANKAIVKSIVKVMKKYPDYNHNDMMEFYNTNLTKEQQEKIKKKTKSLVKQYEKVYRIYKGVKNIINIKTMKGGIKL